MGLGQIRSNLRKQCGDKGEDLVARYIEKQGFTVVARNYTRRTGEIDLIAACGNIIAFVEVKTRSRSFFDLTELISEAKQKRILSAAKSFIIEQKLYDNVYRFDVALIDNLDNGDITYIPNAFTQQEY